MSACDPGVGSAFDQTRDSLHDSQDYVGGLLERGVRVLIYVGTHDWICNWVGNERMTLALEWSGAGAFRGEPLRPWVVEGEVAGLTRSARGLTFAQVAGAGHMVRFSVARAHMVGLTGLQVPYNQPKASLALIQRWLAQDNL
jgi:carboxypeptidase C (cathepsin A)